MTHHPATETTPGYWTSPDLTLTIMDTTAADMFELMVTNPPPRTSKGAVEREILVGFIAGAVARMEAAGPEVLTNPWLYDYADRLLSTFEEVNDAAGGRDQEATP